MLKIDGSYIILIAGALIGMFTTLCAWLLRIRDRLNHVEDTISHNMGNIDKILAEQMDQKKIHSTIQEKLGRIETNMEWLIANAKKVR